MLKPTHLRTVHNGWSSPKEVELVSVDITGTLATIKQYVHTYFERPRIETKVVLFRDLTPLSYGYEQ